MIIEASNMDTMILKKTYMSNLKSIISFIFVCNILLKVTVGIKNL